MDRRDSFDFVKHGGVGGAASGSRKDDGRAIVAQLGQRGGHFADRQCYESARYRIRTLQILAVRRREICNNYPEIAQFRVRKVRLWVHPFSSHQNVSFASVTLLDVSPSAPQPSTKWPTPVFCRSYAS